ncbi:hypothetical protein BH23GEM9_BH23GEM9_11950 [soil metagenome]
MRVFRLSDGTSWVARLHEGEESTSSDQRSGWDVILFEVARGAIPDITAQRLVYRPPGWLAEASVTDLLAALEEGVAVRVRWGE